MSAFPKFQVKRNTAAKVAKPANFPNQESVSNQVVTNAQAAKVAKVAKVGSTASRAPALSLPTAASTTAPVSAPTAATAAFSNRTEPPEPGSTQPFGQRELDAVKQGAGCWVWSGVLEEWLFWVRDEERRRKAQDRDIEPGCIWTLPELTGVVGMPAQDLRNIAAIKRKFSGAIVPGAVPARWRSALSPLEPAVAEEVLA